MFPSPSSPWLRFDFRLDVADESRSCRPLIFTYPEQVLVAHRLDEVLPALAAVQEAVQNGFYAAGYVAYEAAPAFDAAMRVRAGDVDSEFPLLWFGIFTQPQEVPENACEAERAALKKAEFTVSDWRADTARECYDGSIEAIRDAIARGETYQVNYTLRLRAEVAGDDFALYERLLRAQQANYGAYLDLGRCRILSASPELFFHRKGSRLVTRPMKGTCGRGRWQEEDQKRAQTLAASEKNRAENIMIVDLLRNDLGKLAVPGSVQVAELFALERYPTLWQMTSTIAADVPPDTTLTDIFQALFPCGSITGAPKIETMRHIAKLEDAPRHVYCGAIGLLTPDGTTVFNVAIRTLLLDTQTHIAEYGVGSGITWDSTPQDEYAELLTKAAVLTEEVPVFDLLETLRLENGHFWLLERHLQRMSDSAAYFGYAFPDARIREELAQIARQVSTGTWRVRLLLAPDGTAQTEVFPLVLDSTPRIVILANSPVESSNRFLYHKTTHRAIYDQHRHAIKLDVQKQNMLDAGPKMATSEAVYDILLWNERGELTEFTTGNLVVKIDGYLWTPPRECGLLAGTFRAELLAQGIVQERILTREDLNRATACWLINSVRSWLPVQFVGN